MRRLRACRGVLAVAAVLGTMLVAAVPAAAQDLPPNVSGVGGGLAAGLGVGTRSADPCSLYEPNEACTNARGKTESLGFGDSNTWKPSELTCSGFPPFFGARPYVSPNEYSIDTSGTHFTDPGLPVDYFDNDPTTGKTLWLAYSITVTNWGSRHDFTPVLACY